MAIVASAHRLDPVKRGAPTGGGASQCCDPPSRSVIYGPASTPGREPKKPPPVHAPWLGWGTGGGGSRPENSRCGQMKASASRVNQLPSPRPCMVGGLDHADLVPRPHRLLYRNGARDFIIPVETIRLERGARSSGPPLPGEDIPWRVCPSRLPSVGGSCSGDPPAS